MTKTKNRKGKKKRMKHLDNVAARAETVRHQTATFSSGIPAGGLVQFLKDNDITDVAPWQEDVMQDVEAKMQRDADLQDRADYFADLDDEQDRRLFLGGLNITDLRKYSKGSGIPGAYGLKKDDLIEAIISAGWVAS